MKFYADLHIHSHYSMATSSQLTPEYLAYWARIKGISVVGTGDFVHPGWLSELKEKLRPSDNPGLFELKPEYSEIPDTAPDSCLREVRFMLSAEVSGIYKRGGKVRKVHNIIFSPDFAAAERIQSRLDKIGNITSDGRPILGLDSRDLLEIVLEASDSAYLIPAHIWTPWFSVLGSKSGFDVFEECYGDLSDHIFAVETGLSSDPPMNWRLSQLDKYILVSNSDAHSPAKLGREANIFDTDLSYNGIFRSLRDERNKGLKGTVEFFPQEGKYHLDGHRKCNMCLNPEETIGYGGICPECGKGITVGVCARVEELADRPEGSKGKRWRPFHSLIPLTEVISEIKGIGPNSKGVKKEYQRVIKELGSDFDILLDIPVERIKKTGGELLAEGIRRMRERDVIIRPGYDGKFGTIKVFHESEMESFSPQVALKGVLPKSKKKKGKPGKGKGSKKKVSSPVDRGGRTTKVPAENEGAADALGEKQEKKEKNVSPGSELNRFQVGAVEHKDGNLLIVAGPGTGKTHTLTSRIIRIAEEERERNETQRILAVTFTNKAAAELENRLKAFKPEITGIVDIGTFHRVSLSILREFEAEAGYPEGFSIASVEEIRDISRILYPELNTGKVKGILSEISLWKACGCQGDPPERAEKYISYMRENSFLDFDDLILYASLLLETRKDIREVLNNRYRDVFVDEYQDVNKAQERLLSLIKGDETGITAIGDPDQAVYGFRGSSRRYFDSFPERFPETTVLRLNRSYRSGRNIISALGDVIMSSDAGSGFSLEGGGKTPGEIILHEAPTGRSEAEYVVHSIERQVGGTSMFSYNSDRVGYGEGEDRSFSDFCVLYRLNTQKDLLIEAFHRSGIPYQVSGDIPVYQQPVVSLVCDIMRLCSQRMGYSEKSRTIFDSLDGFSNSSDTGTILDSIEQEPNIRRMRNETPVSESAWNLIRKVSESNRYPEDFLDAVLLMQAEDTFEKSSERVSLMTLHASKGLEFPVVFITGCEEGLIPLQRDGTDTEEEKRLFYVGMSRAEERLHLVRAKKRFLHGQSLSTEPSRFVEAIKEELIHRDRVKKPHSKGTDKAGFEQLNLFDM
ncbi:MAG: UvrD-helicase domain-containing protein [Chitinivibrionales bacterium]